MYNIRFRFKQTLILQLSSLILSGRLAKLAKSELEG